MTIIMKDIAHEYYDHEHKYLYTSLSYILSRTPWDLFNSKYPLTDEVQELYFMLLRYKTAYEYSTSY